MKISPPDRKINLTQIQNTCFTEKKADTKQEKREKFILNDILKMEKIEYCNLHSKNIFFIHENTEH